MKYPFVLLGCAIVAFVQPVSAKTPLEIETFARSVSVEMISGGGSGVIVHRQGDVYTVVTTRHIVCKEKKLCDETGVASSRQLKMSDGQVYQVERSAIKLLKDTGGNRLDLAILQFHSSRNYSVAQVAEPGNLKMEDVVYSAGFPQGQDFLFSQGVAHAVVNKRLVGDKGGYTVIYDAETLPGMSGGGIFDRDGRLVAIHGQGDRLTENTEAGSSYAKADVNSKIGYNRGISIRWVVQGLDESGIAVGNRRLPRATQERAAAAATADEFFIAGFNKLVNPGEDIRAGREEAVRQFSQAITLNPRYTIAYFMRGYVNEFLGNYSSVLADLNQAISLNPNIAVFYNNRGLLKAGKLNEPQGALADFNQAIAINPSYALAYNNRGLLKAGIEAIARRVSVKIQIAGSERVGSGVIVHRQGKLYTLLTNRHVVCGEPVKKRDSNKVDLCTLSPQQIYHLTTTDNRKYSVPVANVKIIGSGLDLAIIQFRSSQNYSVSQLAEPGSLKVGNPVYTSGFPRGQGFLFRQGIAHAVVNKRLTGDNGGYTVIYNAETSPGMSGGGAFDQDGQLVAIHGYGDRYKKNTEIISTPAERVKNDKIGYNRGIPVRWIIDGLRERGIAVGTQRLPQSSSQRAENTVTADEFFIAGFNKIVDTGEDMDAGRQVALGQLSQAIKLNPKYAIAHFMRAIVNNALGNHSLALADYDQAIAINPSFVDAYRNRAWMKHEKFNDVQGALDDFNQAVSINSSFADEYDSQDVLTQYKRSIAINPNSASTYASRGFLKDIRNNDSQGALADYNQAIMLNPKSALVYYNRGRLKVKKIDDSQGALADFNQAIAIDPRFASAYYSRGILKVQKINDSQGALVDFNQAIAINPEFASAYYSRGILKIQKINDSQGALVDFNQAIAINPEFASAYYSRGILKIQKINDSQGAIQDLQMAAKIFQAQGSTTKLQIALDTLQQLSATQ